MPRISALLMLRSTISTVSAPATCLFRGSITNPTQLLCTLRGRRYRRLTQHLLPGGPLRLTRAGLSPAGLHQLLLAPSEIQASPISRCCERDERARPAARLFWPPTSRRERQSSGLAMHSIFGRLVGRISRARPALARDSMPGQRRRHHAAGIHPDLPLMRHRSIERMPTDACQFFYDCKGCGHAA